ncbi:MAG: HAD-IA family hydrolase [Acidobacteria bacterium]|nr:HAD-IA family hydrolase [Acidobacteriota bacterium]
MSYRHFVFDLDGTLIDSRQDLADSVNVMLDTYGAAPLPAAEVVPMVGEGARILVERVLASARQVADVDEALSRFLEAYDARLTATTRLYDGVLDTLAHLRTVAHISVLTNKPQLPSERIVHALGLRPHVHEVIGGDSPFGRKPSPGALAYLIEQGGVGAARTLLVGDSWVDVATAVAGGVDACLVTYGFGYETVDAAHRQAARWTIPRIGDVRALQADIGA